MAHTYTVLLYHLVFSTKKREPRLTPELKQKLYPYMAGIISNHGGNPIIINGVEDHVHILCQLKSKPDIADILKSIKGSSSHWVHEQNLDSGFAWQEGYGAFTVSFSQKQKVYRAILESLVA